jgi:CPA2 family monovalent cation:H+ antiporter-2
MDLWTALLDLLILLIAAMALGGVADRFKQSPLLGYLVAGTLLGPNALNLLPSHEALAAIAELGIALLLFTIGLEFSWRKLRAVGPIALGGGTLQLLLTGAVTAGLCLSLGLDAPAAVAIGAMIALSSTAAVIRLLASRAELDAVHGRNALGILLLQDVAVVPIILLIAVLSGGPGAAQVGWAIGSAVLLGILLVGILHVILNYVLPHILSAKVAAQNRDVPILLAIVTAVGAAWVSHALGFSPVLGAFLAGMLLAESPYATQIRADIVPLRTLFVTLFFSSIGMLSNPAWAVENWSLLLGVVAAVVVGKAAITTGVVRLFRCPLGQSLATAMVLAQVGEFSLVAASVAQDGRLIDAHAFNLLVATLISTLFLTPYLVAAAPPFATLVGRHFAACETVLGAKDDAPSSTPLSGHLVLIGFGPAGQRVAEELMGERDHKIVVVEQNPRTADAALAYELETYVGDATREELLERVHADRAAVVVVTLPDPATARLVVQRVRGLAPNAFVIVRSRYHVHRWQLNVAGAHAVVDEEDQVGASMAAAAQERLRQLKPESPPQDS